MNVISVTVAFNPGVLGFQLEVRYATEEDHEEGSDLVRSV